MDQCVANKDDGTRCGVKRALEETPDGLMCVWHDPARAEQAQGIRDKGVAAAAVRNRQTLDDTNCPDAPTCAADVVEWSSRLTVEVATGVLDPKRAQQVTNLLKLFLDAIAKADLETKIKELVKELARLRGDEA